MNREAWLIAAIEEVRPLFKQHGADIPQVKVSTGFGYGRGKNSLKIAGQFWSPKSSDDSIGTVFISPLSSDSLDVLGTLVHELVHAVVGVQHGHGPVFRKLAVAVGLTGKMASSKSSLNLVAETLKPIIEKIGAYPHATLRVKDAGIKKQTTRMVKQECKACEYIVRSSLTAIKQHGPVICPGCSCQMEVG
jgi:hypothetical protein